MSLKEGQRIDDSFEAQRDAFRCFAGCTRTAAAGMWSSKNRNYEAHIQRLTDACVLKIWRYMNSSG